MTGKGSQYLTFSRQQKNFQVAAAGRKIGNIWSCDTEASEQCGGTQSSRVRGFLLSWTGVHRPAAWAAVQHCIFLVWLHLFVYLCSWHCLGSLLGRVTAQEETNRLRYLCPSGCCLELSVSSSGVFCCFSKNTKWHPIAPPHPALPLPWAALTLLKGEAGSRAVWGFCGLQQPQLCTQTPLCYAVHGEQKESKKKTARPKRI